MRRLRRIVAISVWTIGSLGVWLTLAYQSLSPLIRFVDAHSPGWTDYLPDAHTVLSWIGALLIPATTLLLGREGRLPGTSR